jgi:hypothetical protein
MSMKNRSMRETRTSHNTMANNKITTISSKTATITSTPKQQDHGEEGKKGTW